MTLDEINSGKGKQRLITDSELNRARELEKLINQGLAAQPDLQS
jgi:hypothetical protein